MITLEAITEATFKKIIDMKLPPEQNKFVAPNVVSLAQAWLYYGEARPFAVSLDGEPVGFIMLDWDEDERTVGIWRFMIAPEHQNRGYGRLALEAAIDMARRSGKFDLIALDYVPGNDAARHLYASLGFAENGDVESGEIVMTMRLTDKPGLGHTTADEDDLADIDGLLESFPVLPKAFSDAAAVHAAVSEGRLCRLAVYGDTVGAILDGELLLKNEYSAFLDDARALIAEA